MTLISQAQGMNGAVRPAVELVVDPSAVQSVWVTYDDNLLDRVETRVEGDVLVVELSGNPGDRPRLAVMRAGVAR